MESPVRICLGAALVVSILLLSGTSVTGIALPPDTTPTTVKEERAPRYGRINGTWTAKNRPKSPDVSINELKPKDSTSEEHTEKNAKYKDRGRVRYFNQLKTTTESPLRRIRSTVAPLVIVTPTPEVKKPQEIIDSMRTYKRTKLPLSSTTPLTVDKEDNSEEYEDEEDDEEDKEPFEKFSPSKFDNFFTMPSYSYGDDFNHNSDSEGSDNKVNKNDYNSPSYGGFSSLFREETPFGYKDTTHDIFKSESFFSFDSDLTTPKNDYFDKKFEKISSSILKNLDTIKAKAPPANTTNIHKIVHGNVDLEKVGNNTPSNKSSVFIKNTKEIRLLDSDGASSANKELSDVQGTSIYYEMSVLSTETYAINSEDDCDDSLSAEPTVSTSSEEELSPLNVDKPTVPISTKSTLTDADVETVKPTIPDPSPTSVKQTLPKPKSDSRTKISRFDRIKSTTSSSDLNNDKPTVMSEKFERVRTTSSNEKFDSVKTTSATMRRKTTKSTSSTLKAVSTKSSRSRLRSDSVKPTVSDSSAESAKTTLTSLDFEPAKPTFDFESDSILSTIPNVIFDSTLNPEYPSLTFETIKPTHPDPTLENVSVFSTDVLPISSVIPIFNSINTVPVPTQNIISTTTDRTLKTISNSYTRNRNYSKRLNLNANNDSPNSVTSVPELSSTPGTRSFTRKFHHSTPRTKSIWMAPRRNVTKSYAKPTYPTTIYSEHFNIKDKYKKFSTVRPRLPYKAALTTTSSEIDPILETDVGGAKIVQSQSIVDNTVPSLWKRGSTKFGGSTTTSSEASSEGEWQIPPTSAVWALASMRSPPPSPNATINGTKSSQKSVDENELQKVGEVVDKKETTTTTSTSTTASSISNDIIPKVTEVDQNKLPWQPIVGPKKPSSESQTAAQNEIKSETEPAESNISVKSSPDPTTTGIPNAVENKTENWVPVNIQTDEAVKNNNNDSTTKAIPPAEKTKSTSFESITKLPADVTTPHDETVAGSEVDQKVSDENPQTTTDFTITTIRFSYVPTEKVETETQPDEITPTTWHPVFPTRTKLTPVKDTPVTTYRPRYKTTTEMMDESTTIVIPETTSGIEVSSQVLENSAKLIPVTTEMSEPTTTSLPTTTEVTTQPTTAEVTSEPTTVGFTTESTTIEMTTEPTTVKLTTQPSTQAPTTPPSTTEVEDITTIVVEVVTEINTEKEQIIRTTTPLPETIQTTTENIDDCTEESSGSNEINTETTPEVTTLKQNSIPPETTQPTSTTVETPNPTTYKTSTEVIEHTTTAIPEIKPEIPDIPETMSESPETTTEAVPETTKPNARIIETTVSTTIDTSTTDSNEVEDLMSYGEVTTKASSITLNEEDTGSGAAIAIAVSTIGVIALILLIGLLLVVRRRGRRGIYAQRCTPVSLDAYSLDSVSVGHRKGNHRLRASKRSYGNPAYDDEVTSHPMQYAALANFAMDIESMTAEFAEIPSVTVRPEEVPPGCEDKNRYSNVLPLPETRVPLRRIGNDPTTEYINANYVTGPGNIKNYYIACQAPLSNTVTDFWRMIWEQNSRLIVMLTEYMENGVEKCYEYLPPSEISDNKRTFGDFKIILKKREQRDKYAISSVQLINLATRTWREVTHLWYFWPAKGVPDDYDSIIDFLCEMRSYMKISQTAKEYDEEGVEVIYGDQNRSSFSNLSKLREDGVIGHGVNVYSPARAEEQMRRAASNNGTLGRLKAASEVEGIRPCVVTCASGAGRSGALLALDVCARALPAAADVPRAVRLLRAQRPHALSNRHHYIFVYKVLSEYGNKMLGGGVDTI